MTLVIGIDPGTASTGYGLIRQKPDGALETVDFGLITTDPSHAMPLRLERLHRTLMEILALHQPESGAVEKLFFQRNVSTAMTVGQARGVLLLALAEAKVEVHEYTPREIKQAVVGYGNATKAQMQDMVRVLLGLESKPRPDDAADALAVAICHLHSRGLHSRIEESL
jgi:crossover junction endodeoxyribonuclease RuvC